MKLKLSADDWWRLALAIATVCLVAAAFYLKDQFVYHRDVVPGSGGSPVLVVTSYNSSKRIDAWDPATNQWRNVVPVLKGFSHPLHQEMVALRGGSALAWTDRAGMLHLVDIRPSGHHQLWSLPPEVNLRSHIVAISPDNKFALLEYKTLSKGGAGYDWDEITVDLTNAKIVASNRLTEFIRLDTERDGIFTTYRKETATKPSLVARWRFDDLGRLELVEDLTKSDIFPMQRFSVARSATGALRRLAENETPAANETLVPVYVQQVSRDGKRFLVNQTGQRYPTILGQTDSMVLQPLALPRYYGIGSPLLEDDQTLVGVDNSGNVQLIDLDSGKIITRDFSGNQKRTLYFVASLVLAMAAALWGIAAMRERNPFWAIFDCAPIGTIVGWSAILYRSSILPNSIFAQGLVYEMDLRSIGFGVAILASAAITAGWYGVYGRGSIAMRSVVCLVWLGQTITPLAVLYASDGEGPYSHWKVWSGALGWSILLSTAVATVAAAPQAIGYQASDQEARTDSRRFGLASLFTLLAVTSLALAIARVVVPWLYETRHFFYVLGLSGGAVILGFALPASFLSRSRWYQGIVGVGGTALAFLVVAATLAVPSTAVGLGQYWDHVLWVYLPVVCLAIALTAFPGWLARRHGWRWASTISARSAAVPAG
jgi:hypothetical protein